MKLRPAKLLVCATAITFLGFAHITSNYASAQVTHGISAVVNNDIITSHDLRQRVLFIFATTGAERNQENLARIQTQALRNLVDEKIRLQESEKYEQTISQAEIDQSVARLLGRNGIDPNEVVQRLASVGISIDTLRDQVESEIAWQRIINGLYGSRIRISDDQIDENLSRITTNVSEPRYRVGEIYIEATADIGGPEGAMEGARAMIAQVNQGAPFPLLAQQFSSAPSAAVGGDVGWVRLGELRPEIDAAIENMEPGTISEPIVVPGGVYVITLIEKDVSEADTQYKLQQINIPFEDPNAVTPEIVEAATQTLKDTQAQIETCDTLEETVRNMDGISSADMGELKGSEVSPQMLERLTPTEEGEFTDPIVTPTFVASIMVCNKTLTGSNVPTRDQVEDRLIDQQLAQASKRHLRDLRQKATIIIR